MQAGDKEQRQEGAASQCGAWLGNAGAIRSFQSTGFRNTLGSASLSPQQTEFIIHLIAHTFTKPRTQN